MWVSDHVRNPLELSAIRTDMYLLLTMKIRPEYGYWISIQVSAGIFFIWNLDNRLFRQIRMNLKNSKVIVDNQPKVQTFITVF